MSSIPSIINCVFHSNKANTFYGGGFYSNGSVGKIVNCTFMGNEAGDKGGAIRFQNDSSTVANCIFADNIVCETCSADEEHISLYNSPGATVTHSCLKGGSWNTNENTDADPLFEDASQFDLRLRAGSPCIDEGDNDFVLNVPKDIHGDARILDGTVDMGAYEYHDDCNNNGAVDTVDITSGYSQDCNENGIPDECDIETDPSLDCNGNGDIDECELVVVLRRHCR